MPSATLHTLRYGLSCAELHSILTADALMHGQRRVWPETLIAHAEEIQHQIATFRARPRMELAE